MTSKLRLCGAGELQRKCLGMLWKSRASAPPQSLPTVSTTWIEGFGAAGLKPRLSEALNCLFPQRSNPYRAALSVLFCVVVAAAAASAQEINIQNESGATIKMTAAEIAALPHQEVTVDDHGKTVRFEGVPLKLVLEKAGVTFGETLRGKRLASCLLVEAADSYKVVIALPELDPGFTDRVILLADKADGHPLDSREGPFRVVVPGEKRAARWVRQVTGLKIVQMQ